MNLPGPPECYELLHLRRSLETESLALPLCVAGRYKNLFKKGLHAVVATSPDANKKEQIALLLLPWLWMSRPLDSADCIRLWSFLDTRGRVASINAPWESQRFSL